MEFFATCPKGLEYLLVDELKALGAADAREALVASADGDGRFLLNQAETLFALALDAPLDPAALSSELRLLHDASKKLEARITGLETQAEAILRAGKSAGKFQAESARQTPTGW